MFLVDSSGPRTETSNTQAVLLLLSSVTVGIMLVAAAIWLGIQKFSSVPQDSATSTQQTADAAVDSQEPLQTQFEQKPSEFYTADPIDVSYLPADSEIFAVIRLHEVLESSFVQELLSRTSGEQKSQTSPLESYLGNVETISLGISGISRQVRGARQGQIDLNRLYDSPDVHLAIVVRMRKDVDEQTLLEWVSAPQWRKESRTFAGTDFYVLSYNGGDRTDEGRPVRNGAAFLPDEKTLVVCDEEIVTDLIEGGSRFVARQQLHFVDPRQHVLVAFAPEDSFALSARPGSVQERVGTDDLPNFEGSRTMSRQTPESLSHLAELESSFRAGSLGITFADGFGLQLRADFADAETAEALMKELQRAVGDGIVQLNDLKTTAPPEFHQFLKVTEEMLDHVQTRQIETTVELTSSLPGTAAETVFELPQLAMNWWRNGMSEAMEQDFSGAGQYPLLSDLPSKKPFSDNDYDANELIASSSTTKRTAGVRQQLNLSDDVRSLPAPFRTIVPTGRRPDTLLYGMLHLQGVPAQEATGVEAVRIEAARLDSGQALKVVIPGQTGTGVPVVRENNEKVKNRVSVPILLERPAGSDQSSVELKGQVTLLSGGRRSHAMVPLVARLNGPVLPAPLFRRVGLRIRLQRPSSDDVDDPQRGVRVVVDGSVAALAGLEIVDRGQRIDTSRSWTWDGRMLNVVLVADRRITKQAKLKVVVTENPKRTDVPFHFRRVPLPGMAESRKPDASSPPKRLERPKPLRPINQPDAQPAPSLQVSNVVKLEKPGNHGGFQSFAFSPDDQSVAGGTGVITMSLSGRKLRRGGAVLLWDARTGRLKKTLGTHDESVRWVAFSADGETLASASRDDGVIKIWQMPAGRLRHTLKIAAEPEGVDLRWPRLSLSPDGNYLMTINSRSIPIGESNITSGGDLTVWDLTTGKQSWSITEAGVYAATFSSDSRNLIGIAQRIVDPKPGRSGGIQYHSQYTLRTWASAGGDVDSTVSLDRITNLQFIRLVEGDRQLAVVNNSGLLLVDRARGEAVTRIDWHSKRNFVGSLAFSPDDNTIGRASVHWGLELTDVASGESKGALATEFPNSLWNAAFSRDLSRVACSQNHEPVVLTISKQDP